jgi:hypothetical protein
MFALIYQSRAEHMDGAISAIFEHVVGTANRVQNTLRATMKHNCASPGGPDVNWETAQRDQRRDEKVKENRLSHY